MKLFGFFILFFSGVASADPQFDLCAAIKARDKAGLIRALAQGADPSGPCEGVTAFQRAKEAQDKEMLVLLANFEHEVRLPLSRPNTPESDEQDEDLDSWNLIGLNEPTFPFEQLPDFIRDEYSYRPGFVFNGKPLWVLDSNKLIKKEWPAAEEIAIRQQIIEGTRNIERIKAAFFRTPLINWEQLNAALPESETVFRNIRLLRLKLQFLHQISKQLSALQVLDLAYTNFDANLIETGAETKDEHSAFYHELETHLTTNNVAADTLSHYIHFLEHNYAEPTIQMVRDILGVDELPHAYDKALHMVILASREDFNVLRRAIEKVRAAAKAPENQTSAYFAELIQLSVELIHFNNAFVDRTMSVLANLASLTNSQFHSDSLCSLLIPDSSLTQLLAKRDNLADLGWSDCDKYLRRELPAELRLAELVGLKSALSTGRTAEDLKLLGDEGLRILKEDWANAVRVAANFGYPGTMWKSFYTGLGYLFHAGWSHRSVPTEKTPHVLKATRTLGMSRGKTVAFGVVLFDFSRLGAIRFEQAKAILSIVDRLSNLEIDKMEYPLFQVAFDKVYIPFAKLFSEEQKEIIGEQSRRFVIDANKKIYDLHNIIRTSINAPALR